MTGCNVLLWGIGDVPSSSGLSPVYTVFGVGVIILKQAGSGPYRLIPDSKVKMALAGSCLEISGELAKW